MTMCASSQHVISTQSATDMRRRWGESAGGISVALQLLTNNGDREGLFRGAFMQSGGPIPVGDVSHGQPEYDGLVQRTGCESATDTLECLKNVPYDILKDAVDDSPSPGGYTVRHEILVPSNMHLTTAAVAQAGLSAARRRPFLGRHPTQSRRSGQRCFRPIRYRGKFS